MKSEKIEKKNIDHLVDIRDVKINMELPKEERIKEYVRQIKNPYNFRCGKIEVVAVFNENGPTLENCIKWMLM